MANNELLDKVMAQIQNDIDRWEQGVWRTEEHDNFIEEDDKEVLSVTCGTSFCFAGWAVQLADEKVQWHDIQYLYANQADVLNYPDRIRIQGGHPTIGPEYRAQRLLDLDWEQADTLFNGHCTLDNLESYVDQIKAGIEGYALMPNRTDNDIIDTRTSEQE